ncbi:hypothetical protein L211DRAFT_849742 [Terfezia boudieri ATCC MYA-4762]|uniref:Crinkler effector protein N-terminal domain-containing protein n=1 Tax=Terfezia boudieri ATCC MYA-4762 TaxID=1051890 RepID=A0A3N4LL03_9PEZI|nr:hypothetical protein L211DRAFT_849742 [Terfezia boudieri ATCC MYA-4762]
MLELNCLVLGETEQNIFTVEIEATKKVSILKDLIKKKKKPVFDYIPADSLTLWKWNKSISKVTVEDLRSDNPLAPTKKISIVFREDSLEEEYIHIIIQAPIDSDDSTDPKRRKRGGVRGEPGDQGIVVGT